MNSESAKPRLKAWREFRGMTQDALADALDTSKGYYSQMERGERPVGKWLPKIAQAFEVDITELFVDPPGGAGDKSRSWEDASPPHAVNPPLTITGAQFRDVFVPLVRRIAGDDAADQVAKKDHSIQAAALMTALAESDEDGLTLTSRLTQYLLTAAAAASAIPPDDPRYDYPRWRRTAESAAGLLLAIAADGSRKSG